MTVWANLMPDEVVVARRLRKLQRRIVIALAVVVAMIVTLYGLSWLQTERARGEFSDAQNKTVELQHQLRQYGPLLQAQSQAAAINSTLHTLMATDVSWRDLIGRVQRQANSAATITGITGAVSGVNGGASGQVSGLPLLNQSGKAVVGSLTIDGTAADNRSVAEFVERLGSVKGLTAPLPATVTGGDHGGLTFSINALVTADALGGRFSTTAPASTGGN